MTAPDPSGTRPLTSLRLVLKVAVAILLLGAVVVACGIGIVAALGRGGAATTWARWGNIGQSFEAVNAVVSALAVAGILISWYFESRNMQVARSALQRSVEAEVRNQHLALIRMAINDPQLAAVWPSVAGGDAIAQKQHFYANEIIQHVWLAYTTGVNTQEQLISDLRFLFASPRIRAFWKETAPSRNSVYADGTSELTLAALADRIMAEYEAVLNCSAGPTPTAVRSDP